jgi:hypothetical protein
VQLGGAKLTEGTRGSAQTLALYENETVGDAVATFCALYQVPQDSKLTLSKTLSKRVKTRAVRGPRAAGRSLESQASVAGGPLEVACSTRLVI